MHIRLATIHDAENVRSVHLSAFDEFEREIVAELAVNLLLECTSSQVLSLVAEAEGVVIAHAAFSPVTAADNDSFHGYILAPVGVKPDYQKHQTGSKLIKRGIQTLSEMDVDILFVYGDPKYYSRFGFSPDAAEFYTPPYKLQYPFGWQGITLNEYVTVTQPVKISCVTSLCDPALW